MSRPVRWGAVVSCLALAVPLALAQPPAARWPQFRGPHGAGVAPAEAKLPLQFGPEKGVLWKTPLPPGPSSPCVWGDRIFLTAFDRGTKNLETICLDRSKGAILWRRTAPVKKLEKTHAASNPAASTPAADGERVYVYFGSCGLLCYDFAGKEQWSVPIPTPKTRFGTGTSPVLAGERVLLNGEYGGRPFLLAVDRRTGKTVWKKERFTFIPEEGYATPLVWEHDGAKEVVLHRPSRVSGHDLKDGRERWWVGAKSTACSSPVAGDGLLFVSTWMLGGEPTDRVKLPTFDELLKRHDKDRDGKLSKAEFPKGLSVLRRADSDVEGSDVKLIWFFNLLDTNRDGHVDRDEWEAVLKLAIQEVEHGLLAIRPGGKGDVTKTHVVWREKTSNPEVPSPLFYRGRVYLVRDGGLVTCLEAKTGKLLYRRRLGSGGAFFSSPVAGDGKVYAASRQGVVTVLAAGDGFKVLARNNLGEAILATPALVDGKVYVRTQKHLYAFGE